MRRHLNEKFSDLFKTVHPQWSDPHYKGKWQGPAPTTGIPEPPWQKPLDQMTPSERKAWEEYYAEQAAKTGPAAGGLPEPPKQKAAKLPQMTKPGVQVVDKETNQEVVQIPGGVDQTVRYLSRNGVRPTRSPGKYESDDYWFLVSGYDAQDIRKIVKSIQGETAGQSLQRRYLPGYTRSGWERTQQPMASYGAKVSGPAPMKPGALSYGKAPAGAKPSLASAFRFQSPLARRKYTMLIQSKLPGRKPQQIKLSPREAVQYLQRVGARPSASDKREYEAGNKTYLLQGFPLDYANKILNSLVGESLLPEPPKA